jgi:hypothetical protein
MLNFFSFFFLEGVWFWGWTQGLILARQVLYHLGPFCTGYFWDRDSLYVRAGLDPPFVLPQVAGDDRCMPLHPAIGWDGVSGTFCLCCPRTIILLISSSWVARITGLSHSAQLDLFLFVLLQAIVTDRSPGRRSPSASYCNLLKYYMPSGYNSNSEKNCTANLFLQLKVKCLIL